MEKCRTEIPKMHEIDDIVKEGYGQKSFFFKKSIECRPGQFIMVWIPDADEKPMAVSYHKKNEFAFTSQTVGKWTKTAEGLKIGDKIGIRGPYGKGFLLKDNACVVAGGVGLSSVSTLIDALKNPTVIYGARSKSHLIFLKRFKSMRVTTDDGSYGKKGLTTAVLDEMLSQNKNISIVQTCGPEIMMKKVLEICGKYNVECEASVERYMSCGFGICGKCMLNDKIVCVDGPVFNSKQLNKMSEFGKTARLKSGRKVTLTEYHSTHN
jgi:dihydroorotate dehydrogenase electron transfer subunit